MATVQASFASLFVVGYLRCCFVWVLENARATKKTLTTIYATHCVSAANVTPSEAISDGAIAVNGPTVRSGWELCGQGVFDNRPGFF